MQRSTEVLVDWCAAGFEITIRSEQRTQDAADITVTANSGDDFDLKANVRDLFKDLSTQSPRTGLYYVSAEGDILPP